MSARLARTVFASATRRQPISVPLSVARVSRRTMSATSHAPAKSSDTPWMIGSLVVFGPALLYLLSPSARKNTHGVHNDHRDFPALEHHQEPKTEPAVETMKDDEGTEANVASSIALSEESDVPNDSTSPESGAETLAAAKTEEATSSETIQEPQASEEGKEKSGTFQEKGGEGPTDLSKAQEAAQKGITPKEAAENKN
ncbi:hypothetical protein BYT27DRAFT_7202762 [Phlegmacium glaucopus]|nr:hypothetical protein BYT27DRAFT_7202762 [Phlegmacium glaucopus]